MEKERAKEILEYCLETVKSYALSKDPNATEEEDKEDATNLKEDAKYSYPPLSMWLPNSQLGSFVAEIKTFNANLMVHVQSTYYTQLKPVLPPIVLLDAKFTDIHHR